MCNGVQSVTLIAILIELTCVISQIFRSGFAGMQLFYYPKITEILRREK